MNWEGVPKYTNFVHRILISVPIRRSCFAETKIRRRGSFLSSTVPAEFDVHGFCFAAVSQSRRCVCVSEGLINFASRLLTSAPVCFRFKLARHGSRVQEEPPDHGRRRHGGPRKRQEVVHGTLHMGGVEEFAPGVS